MSDEHLNLLLDNTKDLIWEIDKNYRLVLANKAYQKALIGAGGSAMQYGDSVLTALYPKELNAFWKHSYDRCLRGEPFDIESIVLFLDGNHYFSNSLSPVYDAQQQVCGVIVISTDISERKRAELKEKDLLAKWKSVVSNVPLVITLLDLDYNVTFINRTEYIFEKSASLGTKIFNFIAPEYHEIYQKTFENVLSTSKDQDFETRFTYMNHTYYITNLISLIILDDQILGFIVISTDITEKKLIQERLQTNETILIQQNNEYAALNEEYLTLNDELAKNVIELQEMNQNLESTLIHFEESEAKYKAAFHTSPDSININTLEGRYVDINEGFTQLTGYTREDVIGKLSADINIWAIPEDRVKLVDGLRKFGIVNNLESKFRLKDGTFKISLMSARILNVDNQPHILSVTRDITERKKMEEEVIKAKERAEQNEIELKKRGSILHAIINNIPFDLWARDNQQVCFIQNESSKKYWDNLIGHMPAQQDIAAETLELWLENNRKVYAGATINEEVEYVDKYNVVRHMQNIIAPIIDNDEILGILGLNIDISDRKMFEKELIAAKEKAEESDRLKTAFLQNMSHEIRTPMNAIIGFSEMLNKTGLSPEKRQSFTEIIINSSKQLLVIVSDILAISTLEAGLEKATIESTSINAILVDLLAEHNPTADEQNISLYLKQGLPDKHATIFTDGDKLRQILTNLLNNALKFIHKGYIEFGYQIIDLQGCMYLQFYVKDTGIGIKPEWQERIFERFHQVDISINKDIKYGGTGLGLSISKAYTELLGGKMWLQSEYGIGSVFYFTIPYNPVDMNILTNQQDLLVLNSMLPTVLIAEDEEFNYLFVEELLIKHSIYSLHAKDGLQAVELCRNNPQLKLVVMDLRMPELDGYEATVQIREFRPDLPIIALTSFALPPDIQKSTKYNFNAYLTKPLDHKKFSALIGEYLNIKLVK